MIKHIIIEPLITSFRLKSKIKFTLIVMNGLLDSIQLSTKNRYNWNT